MKTLTIIPSRLSATRLPGKPLLKINNLSIISHVFKRAQEANIGDVIVAAEDQEIVDDVIKNGGSAILTGKNHKTGTDRIYEAFKKLELILDISREKVKNPHKLIILKGKSALNDLKKLPKDKNYRYKTVDSITDKDSKIIIATKNEK